MAKLETWPGGPSILPGERRRNMRIKAAVQIELRKVGSDVPMRIETADISLGGCYVEMGMTLEVGTKLDIILWLDQKKLCTRGVVVTQHPQFGNGIQFDQMSTADEALLLNFVDSCQDGKKHEWMV
jgi:c-di-GMP-binding flagellar brake protein YcgR